MILIVALSLITAGIALAAAGILLILLLDARSRTARKSDLCDLARAEARDLRAALRRARADVIEARHQLEGIRREPHNPLARAERQKALPPATSTALLPAYAGGRSPVPARRTP